VDPERPGEGGAPHGPPLASPNLPTPGMLIAAFAVVMASVVALLWLGLPILTALLVVAAAALIAICLAQGAVRPLSQMVVKGVSGLSGTRGPGLG
jgi:hypothetical protein